LHSIFGPNVVTFALSWLIQSKNLNKIMYINHQTISNSKKVLIVYTFALFVPVHTFALSVPENTNKTYEINEYE